MADRKISDLTALTAPAAGDYLPIVDISEAAAASKNKRITIQELFRGVPLGTAAAPSIAIEGDEDTGIYSPGANQLAVATGGTQRLTVSTAATTSTLPVAHPLGAVGTPSITFTGDLNTGIWSPAADTIAFSEGGVEAMRITSAGLVGIGTSVPFATLTVDGALGLTAGGSAYLSAAGPLFYSSQSGGTYPFTVNGSLIIQPRTSATPFDIVLATASVADDPQPRLVVKSSGNVGIATTTPNEALEVAGNIHVSGADRTIYNRSNNALAFGTNNVERARIDSSGRLLVGTSTTSAIANTILQGSSGSNSPAILLLASTLSAPADGVALGALDFSASNHLAAARIVSRSDGGTWTAGTSQPTRLEFSTTANGAASPTERLRITNDGVIAHDQSAPAAVNATATLTVANLKTGIITSTSAAATDMTLPTGTDTQAGFSGTYDNFTFDWSVINTGPSLVRVLAGTAHTIVGSGSVATGTSGRFASRRTAANTFVTYRLS